MFVVAQHAKYRAESEDRGLNSEEGLSDAVIAFQCCTGNTGAGQLMYGMKRPPCLLAPKCTSVKQLLSSSIYKRANQDLLK